MPTHALPHSPVWARSRTHYVLIPSRQAPGPANHPDSLSHPLPHVPPAPSQLFVSVRTWFVCCQDLELRHLFRLPSPPFRLIHLEYLLSLTRLMFSCHRATWFLTHPSPHSCPLSLVREQHGSSAIPHHIHVILLLSQSKMACLQCPPGQESCSPASCVQASNMAHPSQLVEAHVTLQVHSWAPSMSHTASGSVPCARDTWSHGVLHPHTGQGSRRPGSLHPPPMLPL